MLYRHILGFFVASLLLFCTSAAFAQGGDKAARDAFAEKFIWSFELLGVDPAADEDMGLNGLYQGKYKEPLTPREFYREIGRPDLVEALDANETRALVGGLITYAGVLGTAAGGTWIFVESMSSADSSYLLPGLVTGASLAVLISGVIYSPGEVQPITQREAWKLADQYNDQLKKDLGLPDDYTPVPAQPAQPAEISYGITPTIGGVAGGIFVAF